jgi:hypothetical protein
MVLGTLPLQAQTRDQDRNRDDAPYYAHDNDDRHNQDSYRRDDDRRHNDADRRDRNDFRQDRNFNRDRDNYDRDRNPRWRPVDYQQPDPRPVYTQPNDTRDFQQHRSAGKSALIVGGSAAVGAGIGALAGGGKGAGIGAIAGGLGGFIYDRLTANHH